MSVELEHEPTPAANVAATATAAASASRPSATPDALSRRRHQSRWDAAICVLLGIASLLIYNANGRSIPAVDTYAARYLPISIWRNHTVVLDPIAEAVAQGRGLAPSEGNADTAWWIRKGRGGDLVSYYPIAVPVVVAPLYAPAVAYLRTHGWNPQMRDDLARIMEKLCASLIAAVSVSLLYLLMRRRCEPGIAIALTLAFALGTTTWVISSQALWMHGLAGLLVVATLLLLTKPCTARRAVMAGFLCAAIPCVRQPDVILAAGLGVYGLWWARHRMIPMFVAGAVPPAVLVLAYNLMLVGPFIGGYALASPQRVAEFFRDDVAGGVAGLLLSPTHGLFVFSPFLLFILVGLPWIFRERRFRGLTIAVGCAAVLQVVLYGLGDWRQGVSWGPRWLTDMLPILFWMLPPVVVALPTAGRAIFGVACCFAIAIEAVGAFWYTGASAAPLFATRGPHAMRAAWDIRNAPFIAELGHPRAPADLLVDLRGNIDLVAVHADPGNNAKRQIEVDGWALANGRTPADAAVRVDGRLLAGTSSFFERPDVVRTLREKAASGYTITFAADGLAPGAHTVSVLVRPMEGGETRLLKQQTFTLAAQNDTQGHDPDLATAARWAARRLAEHQQAPGYWLTAFTKAPRFEDAHEEMNTFLNAVLVDVLDPVAQAAGLVEPVAHARSFLASQIEDDGLVRYHGRPDAPTIGTLGCAITPDTDDTALVWRVAPGARKNLLPLALATIRRFRTPDGLYRTWLASTDRYRCLDPGNDPNPADIAIQIHLLMLLAKADPPAAHALCDALRRRVNDDDIWVYYKLVPTIVILRLADARKAGCPLDLPSARLQTTIPGQAVWVDAVERLRHLDAGDHASAEPGLNDLLRRLADNDFALLGHDPPLLYHNDRTATVSRFYWSEDFGYALWLRLYFENERIQSATRCFRHNTTPMCVGK